MRQSFTHRGIEFTKKTGLGIYEARLGSISIWVQCIGDDQWRSLAKSGFHDGGTIACGMDSSPETAIDAMCHNYAIIHRWLCREMIPTIQSAKPEGTKP